MNNATLSRPARSLVIGVLVVVAATILYPILFLALTAVRSNTDYLADPFGWPEQLSLDNFSTLVSSYGIGRSFVNSLGVVTTAALITLTLAVLAGYGLAKYPVPGARYITGAFVSVMLLPAQVLVIPLYLLLSRIDLVGEYPGLVLVYVATGLPFSVFFLTLSFRGVPVEVMEAARIDGAGFFRALWSVALPMGISGVATVAVLQFLNMWNELLFAFILLPDESKTMLTPALARIGGRYITDQTLVSAGLLVSAVVPIVLLLIASRYIMRGLSAGYSR